VRETHLHPQQFILPLLSARERACAAKSGYAGNYQMSIDELVKECVEVEQLGIGGVILFGLPESKDEMATGAYDDHGIVQRAIARSVRNLQAADRYRCLQL